MRGSKRLPVVGCAIFLLATVGCSKEKTAQVTAMPASICDPMEYKGSGEPDVLVISQMDYGGFLRSTNVELTNAMRQMLDQQNWEAGDHKVAFQTCNDSTVAAGFSDSAKCAQLAPQYAKNPSVVAVIGLDSSSCLQVMTPVLNQAPGGGLTIMSTQATFVCLTQPSSEICDPDEPDKYYPNGTRNMVRSIMPDNYTGAAFAVYAQNAGAKKVYILTHSQPYGIGLGKLAEAGLKNLGIEVVGNESYDESASSYRALFERVKATGADLLMVMAYASDNGPQLIKDKVEVLGPNSEVGLVLSSTFLDPAFGKSAGLDNLAGAATIVESLPPDQLTGAGKQFFEDYAKNSDTSIDSVTYFVPLGAASMQLTLAAIAESDGTRAGVLKAIPSVKVPDSIYGPTIGFNGNGDLSPPTPNGYYEWTSSGFEWKDRVEVPVSLAEAVLTGG